MPPGHRRRSRTHRGSRCRGTGGHPASVSLGAAQTRAAESFRLQGRWRRGREAGNYLVVWESATFPNTTLRWLPQPPACVIAGAGSNYSPGPAAVREFAIIGVPATFGCLSAVPDRVAEVAHLAYAKSGSGGGLMGSKKAEAVDINVDELALSLVGWQVEDAQARLVTEPHSRTGYVQQIAFSATFRFLPEDWTDRFKRSEGDRYASEVFLMLNRRDTPAPSGNYRWVVLEKINKAKKGLIRVSSQSDAWWCAAPLAATDVDLRLTAYDLDDVSGVYINSKLSLPSSTTTAIEIVVVDETSVEAPRPKVAAAHAYVSRFQDKTTLTIHTEGIFEFGSAQDLLKAHLERSEWADPSSTVEDCAPFEVDVPEIKFEILDATGFLLDDRTCRLYGHIPVDGEGNIPRRQPRWIYRDVVDTSNLPGEPQRVVVRVSDGEE